MTKIKKSESETELKVSINSKELVHRLNRAIGQLEAIKRSLETQENEKNCIQTMRLLKAANNAIKKFGEAYINEHLSQCMSEEKSTKEIEKGLKDVISSVFSMS